MPQTLTLVQMKSQKQWGLQKELFPHNRLVEVHL